MSLVEVIHIWRRRWILATFVLIIALVGCGAAALTLPRTYQAECTVVLIPSHKASGVLGEGNPYLSFTDSLSTAADVMVVELMSPATDQDLLSGGFDEPYSAVAESTTSQTVASGSVLPGPFVAVTVSGSNQQAVENTLHGVRYAINTTARAMQAGIPRNDRIGVYTLSLTPKAIPSGSKSDRTLLLIMGLLVAFAISTPVIVDAQITRWRIHRAAVPHQLRAQHIARPLPQDAGEVSHR